MPNGSSGDSNRVRDFGIWGSGLLLGASLTWWTPALSIVVASSLLLVALAGYDWYRSTDS